MRKTKADSSLSNVLRYKDEIKQMIDHQTIQPWTGFEPMTSAMPGRSYQPSYQAKWELVPCEFVTYP